MTSRADVVATVRAVDDPRPYTVHLHTGGHALLADEPPGRGGANAGPNPTQLLLASLGACTAMTLRMYAERHGWEVGRLHVRLVFLEDGDTRRIEREVRLDGALDEAQRARLREIVERTPVTLLLREGTPITTVLH